MAPEQFCGQAVPATDLYGLGATVLFLLTHRSPSDLPQERLKISFRSRIQVSEGFADWLEKMLEPDVEERFSSAKDALAALQGRMVVAKPRLTVSWKVLAGVGVAGIAAFFILNSYKWTVLGALGFKPSGICEATKSGNIDVVRDYLKHGGNPNAEDDTEQLLLNCASHSSKKEIVELLIAKGADVNAKDSEGGTPLHYATGTREITELLITKGADVTAKDNQGKTPLHMISSEEQAELLIAEGADVNAKDNQGNTPLLLAMLRSKSELARLLIARGADVNVKDNQGNTPLLLAMHWSPMGGRSDSQKKGLARLLIAKGADVNAKDNQGKTPLHIARYNDLVAWLIAKGADVNARDNQGATPLHMAWNNDLVAWLIAKGADVNARDNQGKTLLHIVLDWVPRNYKEMVPLLIAKGADVNAKDNQGATPLEVAFRNLIYYSAYIKGQEAQTILDTIVLLMAKGAQSSNNGINPRDNEGYTLLHYVARDGSKEAVELLIAKGAQVNANDNHCGCTPLHWAAKNGNKDTAELLIAKGADVNAKAKSGLTPLDDATIEHQENMVKLLRRHGAVGHSCRKIDGFGIVCQVNP